ncbi:MAG TPA: type II CAAX endopeptidase family protein [Candidatus Bathyarchaeia archaeon]|nr:type II CAAX endopeptidase family protein [Candidatus Bathyarchaeia archaeon]
MRRKGSLVKIVCYGLLATLAISYGLLLRQSLFATFIAFHLVVCIGIPLIHGWWEGALRKNWKMAWGEQSFSTTGLFVGIISGVCMGTIAVWGIWMLLQSGISIPWIQLQLEHWGLREQWAWLFAAYMVIGNSLMEELFWRGFVQQRLSAILPRVTVIFLSNTLFALYHLLLGIVLFGWKWGSVATVAVFGAGTIWGWMKNRYPTIYPTWFSHLLADAGIMSALFLWIY